MTTKHKMTQSRVVNKLVKERDEYREKWINVSEQSEFEIDEFQRIVDEQQKKLEDCVKEFEKCNKALDEQRRMNREIVRDYNRMATQFNMSRGRVEVQPITYSSKKSKRRNK